MLPRKFSQREINESVRDPVPKARHWQSIQRKPFCSDCDTVRRRGWGERLGTVHSTKGLTTCLMRGGGV